MQLNNNQQSGEMSQMDGVFLATTALEGFWDASRPIVFLGKWCCLYSRKSFWETLNKVEILPSWLKEEEFYATSQYLDDVYERMLAHLTELLNRLHKVNYSNRYWRIVIGVWLMQYVHVVYDRYKSLTAALNAYPNLSTICLAEESFVTPKNTIHFIDLLSGDFYNLQLYSKILILLGKKYPTKLFKLENENAKDHSRHFWRKIKKNIRNFFYSIADMTGKGKIYLFNAYFSTFVEIMLFVRTKGRVRPLNLEPSLNDDGKNKLNHDMRALIKGCEYEYADEFEKILAAMLPYELPYLFLEAFGAVSQKTRMFYPQDPKAIFSSISWTYDELFKYWAAAAAEKGALLLVAQHGGNYGAYKYMAAEDHEINIADKYYSWGWEKETKAPKIKAIFTPLLMGRRPIGANNMKTGIFLVTTSWFRYMYRFQYANIDDVDVYIGRQFRFATSLNENIKGALKVRLYMYEYGWDCEQRWKDNFNDTIHIEKTDTPFVESLNNCRVAVFDHLSTTFMEALAVNKPTILFGKLYELSSEAKPYYEALRRVGIYYSTPEEAAQAINSFYHDVEAWWNDPERKKVVAAFCSKFARTSKNAINEWHKEFENILT